MATTAFSGAEGANPEFLPFARTKKDEGNLSWGERAAIDVGQIDPQKWTYAVLLGGSDTLSFRLRVAQSHLRPDMLPSFWSEVLLVELHGTKLKDATAISVPLMQPSSVAYPPYDNGIVEMPLTVFDDPAVYPNIAIAALPIPQQKVRDRVERFRKGRSALDSLEHVLRWLAFAWGVARTGNPLHENFGLPSACMLEMVCAAEDYELTPGLESRASCPEAIWASLLYWHNYYAKTGSKQVPYGRYCTPHGFDILEPADRPHRKPPEDEPKKTRKGKGKAA